MRTLPTTMILVLAPFAPTFLQKRLPACPVALGGRNPHPGKEDRSLRPASGGPAARTALLSLPSGAQPCRLVESGGKRRPAGVARGSLRSRRTARCGHRRDLGEAAGEEDLCQRHLPRPSALEPRALRQNERPQVGVPGAFDAGALGLSGVVLAVLECPSLLRALRPRAGQAAQESHRMGVAAAEALVPRA